MSFNDVAKVEELLEVDHDNTAGIFTSVFVCLSDFFFVRHSQ